MSTPWRVTGDVSFDIWRQVLTTAKSPLVNELAASYAAAKGYTRLCLAMMAAESQFGTDFNRNSVANRNALNLRPRGGLPGYQAFPTWSAGLAEWKARITDPAYAYRDTQSVADLVAIYAPKTDDNDPVAYAARVQSLMNSWPVESIPAGDVPVSSIVFGRVPHPEYFNHPLRKPEGFGQNDLGQRSVKGVVWHRILGSLWGNDQYFALPSTAALTDYGVGVLAQDGAASDGQIIRWNDPLGRQSGWASGSYSSFAYGDGAAFVGKYGINAINRDQASIEISGFQNTPLSDEAKDAIAALTAHWADQARIPWDVFPIAPDDGFSFVRWHEEFGPDNGQKKCPFDVVKAATPDLIERTRAILKLHQQQATPPEPPKPPAPKPSKFPKGMTAALAKRLYGSVKVSWASKSFTFDLTRSECRAWLERGKASIKDDEDYTAGHWPQLADVIRRGDGSRVYQYSDGTSYER